MIYVEIESLDPEKKAQLVRGNAPPPVYQIFSTDFSGGELHVQMPALDSELIREEPKHVRVVMRMQTPRDLVELMLTTELLRRELAVGSRFDLVLPYLPYARQDRVTDKRTAFSLRSFAKLINSLNYDCVLTYDPHSDVSPALIENLKTVEQDLIVTHLFKGLQEFITTTKPIILAPDAGAAKKAWKVAKHYALPFATAEKIRNTLTGEIFGTRLHLSFNAAQNANFLIVDDICDGGATFIGLAKEIREHWKQAHISLYVTHGIFSKGFEVFVGHIDRIYCTDTFIPSQFPLDSAEPPLFVGKVTPAPLWRKV